MFRIMSYSVFILALVIFLCPTTLQQTLPPKAVNAERIKLLKDALSWMTFRKNGKLANDQELEPFFGALKDRYLKSKYYRTMIIAFVDGVLPKLTLKENDRCDPAYTLEYKDSHNNSVTDGQLNKFILRSYDKRRDGNRQFCDYREGLVCNQQTSKCECPVGSKMGPISDGSGVKRCLVQENQVCSLIDLNHDPSSNYGALKQHLPEMVFNLEKPLSCNIGTQCRFKTANQTTPLCYEVNNGPWDKGRWDADFGEECTLGLYGDTGQCIHKQFVVDKVGTFPGYTCFNFGPRSQPKSPFVGICELELGAVSHVGTQQHSTEDGFYYDLGVMGFVSPATTALRGQAYRDYARQHLRIDGSFSNWNLASLMAPYAGYRCNIANTEKMLELWKFFKSLEDTPPPGKDYIATETELWTKFEEIEGLRVDRKKKICRFRTELFLNSKTENALRCVRNSTDADGNDGRCEVIPKNEDVTFSWAESIGQYQMHARETYYELDYKEQVYRKDVFEPELNCDPKLGPPPGSEGAAPSTDTDVLEGGYCPPDRGCYDDYSDYSVVYDKNCELKDAKPKLQRNCQNLKDGRNYGGCEKKQLNKLFKQGVEALTSNSESKRGDACNHSFEATVRKWVHLNVDSVFTDGNRYKWLIDIYNFNNGIGGTATRLCDLKKLLQCSESGICECWPGSQPRLVVMEGGTTVVSDYCYMTSGRCNRYDARFIFGDASDTEENEIQRHYNTSQGNQWSSCHVKARIGVFLRIPILGQWNVPRRIRGLLGMMARLRRLPQQIEVEPPQLEEELRQIGRRVTSCA